MKQSVLYALAAIILTLSLFLAQELKKSPTNLYTHNNQTSSQQVWKSGDSTLGVTSGPASAMKNLGKVDGFAVASFSPNQTMLEVAASLPEQPFGTYEVWQESEKRLIKLGAMHLEKGGYIFQQALQNPWKKNDSIIIYRISPKNGDVKEALFSLELE